MPEKQAIDVVKKVSETLVDSLENGIPGITNDQREIIAKFTSVDTTCKSGVFEILPGMTVEEMSSLFFDTNALLEPNYKLWQLNSNGERYYYRYDESGNPEFFPSATTILSQALRQSPFLVEWIASKGLDEAERYKSERAAYGTFMHAAFESLLINRSYNLDDLKANLKAYIDNNKLPDNFIHYEDELKKDVLSFAQFVIDYDVRPYAVEIALVHPYYCYAGMIDCPCSMLEKPGKSKRINAIVDFKSGKKGFYEEAELQLHLYRAMWNVNFEKHRIDKVFNFAPKDWRKSPTYTLKDQTDSINAKKIPALLEIAKIEGSKREKTFTSVYGTISLDAPEVDLSNNVISLSLSELVKLNGADDKFIKKESAKKKQDDKIKNKAPKKRSKQSKSTKQEILFEGVKVS